ncbi:uncharacterized protein F5Z01DRAFT_720236 [Emericellopsis atlantica]|uniref:ER transporter 6TM N-terminal domain-containing protein n=1 Tax=Emericellopsis atlantica TaxID=2614577 RepID=A0A9P7ZR80_9HYPO|nr:uncharacterized protein F5Z01DRAFT_720236 [Emericellopsis atlantica]KAG9256205.1 hypothetical protein F5Z01DRAFT_720236 [Emericellopsis atlantica]
MHRHQNGEHPSPQKQRHRLPQWLNHFNAADLKVFARCWVAVWVSMLLIFIQPALNHIGLAAFLATMVLFIVPPASTVLIYLLATLSLLLGMCLAWAWGLVTMKAALAARPDSTTNAKLAELQQQAVATANQTGESVAWEAQVMVYDGFMLDTRVTIIFYVMGCIFIYAVSRLRCANPKFTLTQVFGIIVTDIFMEFGTSLPSFNGTIPSVLVKPAAIGIGLGAVSSLLIWPRSTSHIALTMAENLTRLSKSALQVTLARLHDRQVTIVEAKRLRGQMIATLKAVQPHMAFLPLDVSRGVWNADDIQSLQRHVRKLMFSSLYLIDFHIARLNAAEMLKEKDELQSEDAHDTNITSNTYQIGQRHRQESKDILLALQRPEQHDIQVETRRAMQESTEHILQISSEAVELAAGCIHTGNSCRWFRKPEPARFDSLVVQLRNKREQLQVLQEESIKMTVNRVKEAHRELFDEEGMLKVVDNKSPLLPSMVIAMVLEERINSFATATKQLLDHLERLCSSRQTPRVWFPSRLQYAFSWVRHGGVAVPEGAAAGESSAGMDKDPDEVLEHTEEIRRRLETTRGLKGSSARRNKFSRTVSASYRWLTNPAGMYSLRMVIVTIALTIPATLPATAGFFYREKGIWAVISAQLVLLVYMSDFTFSLVTRTLGTIFGGALGMVAWYIGAGNGPGNPYGMAAITGAMLLPIVWCRLYMPPAFTTAIIMGSATFGLVIGFSWDEGHLQQYGLPGTGYECFWKRVVTVLIGFLAASIVQVIPRPPSATRHACKTLANSIRTLSDHYALLVSHWGRSDKNTHALAVVSGQITLKVASRLLALDPTIANLKLELSSSPFNQNTLKQAQEQCQNINQALGGLLELAAELPLEIQEVLTDATGIKDDRAIGDIMAVLAIIEQALRTGSPLPERLPTPLIARAVESYAATKLRAAIAPKMHIGDGHHRRYCVAMIWHLKFLTAVDDLLLVLKSVLGERHIVYQWEHV